MLAESDVLFNYALLTSDSHYGVTKVDRLSMQLESQIYNLYTNMISETLSLDIQVMLLSIKDDRLEVISIKFK